MKSSQVGEQRRPLESEDLGHVEPTVVGFLVGPSNSERQIGLVRFVAVFRREASFSADSLHQAVDVFLVRPGGEDRGERLLPRRRSAGRFPHRSPAASKRPAFCKRRDQFSRGTFPQQLRPSCASNSSKRVTTIARIVSSKRAAALMAAGSSSAWRRSRRNVLDQFLLLQGATSPRRLPQGVVESSFRCVHCSLGRSVITLSIMSSGEGSVGVSARPALPTIISTSGKRRMIASRVLRSAAALRRPRPAAR